MADDERRAEIEAACGWCHGEGAIRDAEGKLGEDCPRCKGRSRLDQSPQGEDHEADEWPNVEIVRCRDVGDLLHGHRCGYAGRNELACPNGLPCPGQMYVPLSRVSPSRDGTAAVEDVLQALVDEARGDDEWVSGHDLLVRVGAIVLNRLAEFARPATGEQTDHGGNQ